MPVSRGTWLRRIAAIGATLMLLAGMMLGPIGCGSDDPVQDAADENTQEFEENVEQQSGEKAEDAEGAVDEMNEAIGQTEDAVEDSQ